jgi:hypothetical protein
MSSGPVQTDSSIRSAIDAANNAFMASVKGQDVEGIKSAYVPTARLMPAGVPDQIGREAIGNFFGGVLKSGVRDLKLATHEVSLTQIKQTGTVEKPCKEKTLNCNLDGLHILEIAGSFSFFLSWISRFFLSVLPAVLSARWSAVSSLCWARTVLWLTRDDTSSFGRRTQKITGS